jgi:cell division septation protein DedD
MVDLYENYGAIDTQSYPTFFATITHNGDSQEIFEQFGFNTAPNIVVSKPHMAVVSEMERRLYLQQFKWSISSSDGQVETHKMLEFVNKRTDKDVIYKPTVLTMCKMFFGFIIVAVVGVLAYIKLKFVWNHWVFWLVGSLVIMASFSSSTSPAAQASSTTSSTTSLSQAVTPRPAKPSYSQAETESSMDCRAGSSPSPSRSWDSSSSPSW